MGHDGALLTLLQPHASNNESEDQQTCSFWSYLAVEKGFLMLDCHNEQRFFILGVVAGR